MRFEGVFKNWNDARAVPSGSSNRCKAVPAADPAVPAPQIGQGAVPRGVPGHGCPEPERLHGTRFALAGCLAAGRAGLVGELALGFIHRPEGGADPCR